MHNEEQNAVHCVGTMLSVISKEFNISLYVVDDGSQDSTRNKLESCLKTYPDLAKFKVIFLEKNVGYGHACLAGAKVAQKDGFKFGLFMDSDLTNSPLLIPQFHRVLASDKFDMVKGSRYIEGGGMEGVPSHRQWITILGNFIASALFGIGVKDCTNGFRAVRLKMLIEDVYQERGFPVILEELYNFKKKGARFTEIPYILTSRKVGEGESKFNYKPSVFWAYLKYALRAFLVRYKERTINGV